MNDETIGELYDRLPENEWVEAYGMLFKKPIPQKQRGDHDDEQKDLRSPDR